jgi:2-(1,2-epoxy-1,2-dihydrophenyl)acetyl-CoA isomerase
VADDVTVVLDGHVATVEIHRPPHNYFDPQLIRAIADAVTGLDDDPDARAVVLCAEGRNFCAGADFGPGSDLADHTAELYAEAVRLFEARTPIVAAVQGAAVGGGLGLALAADFRVASPDTTFRCNFARLGFHQGFGISVTLPAVVGQQRALELLYTGGQVKGEEALRIGLADRCVPNDDLRAAAGSLAHDIAGSGPLALRAIKETMRAALVEQLRVATAREHDMQQALRFTDDFAEGVRATAERRPPEFTGR